MKHLDNIDIVIMCRDKCSSSILYRTFEIYNYKCIKCHNIKHFTK